MMLCQYELGGKWLAALAMSLSLVTAAVAGEQPSGVWVIDEIQGTVNISTERPNVLKDVDVDNPAEGQRLVAPFSVTTHDDARLVMSREGDVIGIEGGSMLIVKDVMHPGDKEVLVEVDQSFGDVHYRLKSTGSRDVVVTTPNLRTVVMGTTLTVNVDSHIDEVQLTEGSVAVESPHSSALVALVPGQSAAYSQVDGFLVNGKAWLPVVEKRSVGSGSLSTLSE